MLTAIRERATGWIAWVVIILITIPFALWGINSYFEGGSDIIIAEVDGVDIDATAYRQELYTQQQAITERSNGPVDREQLNSPSVKNRVINNMVDNQILQRFTTKHNFRISDHKLQQNLHKISLFHTDGVFDAARYQTVISNSRFTPQSFEAYERTEAAIRQLQTTIQNSAFASPYERDVLAQRQEHSRSVHYATIKTKLFADKLELTPEAVETYYEDNKARYLSDERIKVNYIELKVDTLLQTITVTPQEVADFYEQAKSRYKTAESRQASHILISVDDGASAEEKQQRLALAEGVLADINAGQDAGQDFAALAKKHSDDPGSAKNGGDLGVVAKGQMVAPFEKAVFSMAAGEVRGPVETQYGYHLIKLTQLQPEQQQTLDAVRGEVETEVKQLNAEQLFAELAESFKNLVFESPEDLAITAEDLSLTVETTDWFTRGQGDGVADEDAVRQAAFSSDVVNEDLASDAIELGFDHLIAVQKVEHEPAVQKPLAEVEQKIREIMVSDQAREQAMELGDELLETLEASAPTLAQWKQVMADNDLKTETLVGKKTDVPAELRSLGDKVYAMSPPVGDTVQVGGLSIANDDYVLFALEKVTLSPLAEIDEAARDSIESQLQSREGGQTYDQLMAYLKGRTEIVVHRDRL